MTAPWSAGGSGSLRALARAGERAIVVEVTRRGGSARVTLDGRPVMVEARRRGASLQLSLAVEARAAADKTAGAGKGSGPAPRGGKAGGRSAAGRSARGRPVIDRTTIEGTTIGGTTIDRTTIEAIVVRVGRGSPPTYSVLIRGRAYGVTLEDPLRRLSRAGGGPSAPGRAEIRSVMPGKVRAILVKQGDEVKAGQGLVVIEAMKMENEIPSPKDGRVVEIGVKPGDAVEAGALLCAVE